MRYVLLSLFPLLSCMPTAHTYEGNYNGDLVRYYTNGILADDDTETVDQGVSALSSTVLRVEFENCPLEFKEDEAETSSRKARYKLEPRTCTRNDFRHEFENGVLRVNSDGELDYDVEGTFADGTILTLLSSGTFTWSFSGKKR